MESKNISVNVNRRVNNLTADQAEKKRHLDRSNQRYHRAKTKDYIRSLQDKIAELSARLEEAESCLNDYRRREHDAEPSLAKTLQPWASESSLFAPRLASTGQSSDDSLYVPTIDPAPSERAIQRDSDNLPVDLGTGMTAQCLDQALFDWEFTCFLDNFPPVAEAPSEKTWEFDPSAASWNSPTSQPEAPIWQQVPSHIPAATKLDEVIISTATTWRAFLQRGVHKELDDPVFPSVASLLNRPSEPQNGLPQSFSETVAAQVWRSPLKTLPERIGFMYQLSHYIRWLVCRSKETYEKMPAFMRPTELQRTVPHAAWISMIPWPAVRDAIILGMPMSRFGELRRVLGPSLSVNWPYPDSTALVESPGRQTLTLEPRFEAHIRRLESWTCSARLSQAFPFFAAAGKSK